MRSPTRALATLPHGVGARGVNENYARELMELHTLGVDGGYTQKDVQEVARALTGWTIEAPRLGGGFVFRPSCTTPARKSCSVIALPAGRGIEDGEEVLDILARAPATAHFIVTQARAPFRERRSAGGARGSLRAAVLEERMATFAKRALHRHVPEFFSRAAYRAKVKTPFELVASALRALGAQPDTTPRRTVVAQLGQPIFGRQTPDGWPDRGDAWMNSGAILNRINFGLRVAAGQVPGVHGQNSPAALLFGSPDFQRR